MPDTGAPWNIPYVAGTDLVSDWPTDSLALANAIDAGLDAAAIAIGSNIVSTAKTDTFTTTSTSYTTITGLTATITPTSASNKILAIAVVNGAMQEITNAGGANIRLNDGTTTSDVGATAGSRIRSSLVFARSAPNNTIIFSGTIVWLYSPATTSAVTIEAEILRGGTAGTCYINRSQADSDATQYSRTASTLTLIEVRG